MKFLSRLILDNLRRFVLGAIFGGSVFAALVGAVCYLIVREEAFWRLATVGTLVSVGTMIAAIVTGARHAATQTLRDWVEKTGAGPMLAKVIFKQALGVSDKKPAGSAEVAAELQGLTLGQAKEKLSEKLGQMFGSGALDRWLPSQGRWLAKKLTSTAGWTVTQSLLDHFELQGNDDQPVDLLAMRDGLATGLNEKAIGLVTTRATMVATGVVIAAGVICVAAAAILSQF